MADSLKHRFDIIYVIDTSASMRGEKIESVNNAMHKLERLLKEEAANNYDNVHIYIRIITFGGDHASWHLDKATRIKNFSYHDINAVRGGRTPMGSAFNLLNQALSASDLPDTMFPPLIVLLSDGWPTDEWKEELDHLLEHSWGKKATKVAIAIGEQADKEILAAFTQDRELVLDANNAAALTRALKWTSTIISATVTGDLNRTECGNNDSKTEVKTNSYRNTSPQTFFMNIDDDQFSYENYSTTESNAQIIVDKANSVMKLYFENKKHESLIESKKLFDEIERFLFGEPKHSYIELRKSFMEKYESDKFKIVKWNEFILAYFRIENTTEDNKIPDAGYDHNVHFIDWFLYENRIIEKRNKKLRDKLLEYFENELFFTSYKKRTFSPDSRRYKFYSSANRAEIPFHEDWDLSTTLILTRMALEQYLKYTYENFFKQDAPDSPSQCLNELKIKGAVTETYFTEFKTLLLRGNTNAHDSSSSYAFAVVHGLEMLKECSMQLK